MRNLLIVVAVLGLATVAMSASRPPVHELVAGQSPRPDGLHIGSKDKAVKVDGVLYLDQRVNTAGSVHGCDGGAGLCYSGKGKLIYDFPALPTGGLITAGNSHICHDSVTTATVTGCAFGDTLLLGIDQTYPSTFGQCEPYLSSAATAKVRCCGFQNDAGAFDMPDASYTVRCFR